MPAIKTWAQLEPVSHNDLNINFVSLDLRLLAVEQLANAFSQGSIRTGYSLIFSDGSPAVFTDGSPILLSS